MSWALTGSTTAEEGSPRVSLVLELSAALGWLWASSGYVVEGRRWCESAIEHAHGSQSPELARCLGELGYLLSVQGHAQSALQATTRAVQIARTIGDDDTLAAALANLGNAQMSIDDLDSARRTFREALTLLGPTGPPDRRLSGLANLAIIEHMHHNYDRSEELWAQALGIGQQLGNAHRIADIEVNMVSLLDRTGRVTEAHQQVRGLIGDVLPLHDPGLTTDLADVYVDILVRLGDPQRGARLFGAALATRERDQIPHVAYQEHEMAQTITAAQQQISAEEWQRCCQLGRAESLDDLLIRYSTD
jgi:tetratricopeptide (TPR) repeat protein